MKSQRKDGRGHWPATKRRSNARPAEVRVTMTKLRQALRKNRQPGYCSYRALAAFLDVDDRTVRRWAAGVDYPPAETLHRIRDWIEDVTQP